ncbi:hypothetical protein QQS21_005856 [Conoideocrella luteorostrata]|uniref:Uncharacterized protein n=1 Tax=Conoideocrella luteorostrata TaxID=1105319 RepID=A0AAJ0CNN5_9HYPO|nr:hypothetical protein QQS21_005856 [Conoideocrella luteorostrata]
MPVTLNIVNRSTKNWPYFKVKTSEKFPKGASPEQYERTQKVLQSSLTSHLLEEVHTSPSSNRLSGQQSMPFYIDADAESLRSYFVEHRGKKELVVSSTGRLNTANYGALAELMTDAIADNVKDPKLLDWVMPSFSTTSDTDTVVASVLFMGATQSYFSYGFSLGCGIPSVIILGEIEDWTNIRRRLGKLEELDREPTQFANMLRPILRNIILPFEDPSSSDVISFWNSIADDDGMSGISIYTGWIVYHLGFCSVPVTVKDNGALIDCTMIAGSAGIQTRPTNELRDGKTVVNDDNEPSDGKTMVNNNNEPSDGEIMVNNNSNNNNNNEPSDSNR